MAFKTFLQPILAASKTRFGHPTKPVPPTEFPEGRTAVLVIHGMGAQKPYATLDQFARGIIDCYGGSGILTQREVLFHPWSSTSINNQKDWTQTLLRITPLNAVTTDQAIDVYEYYWAPVITGLVTARQSLLFLLGAALSPFEYLRDNLNVMDEAEPQDSGWWRSINRAAFLLFRELARMACIYLPFIAIILLLLYTVVIPIGSSMTSSSILPKIIRTAPGISVIDELKIAAAAIRYLFLLSSGWFIFQSLWKGVGGTVSRKASGFYTFAMACIFMLVLFAPLAVTWSELQGWIFGLPEDVRHPAFWLILLAVSIALAFTTIFNPWVLALQRGLQNLRKHVAVAFTATALVGIGWATWTLVQGDPQRVKCLSGLAVALRAIPSVVVIKGLLEYGLLAGLIYVMNGFLTSAIGGLAVYLGADDLSKNAAARAMILHESTETMLKILGPQTDRSGVQPEYDNVVIAAHSLGTVIAMDMLNQLLVRQLAGDPAVAAVQLTKVTGLLTFGSPLNKAIYFFRTRVSTITTVLERILFQLHPLRVVAPLSAGANVAMAVTQPCPNPFAADFQWFNAWSRFDLISGKMFFYHSDLDLTIERGITPWTAHLSYWENPELYVWFSHLL